MLISQLDDALAARQSFFDERHTAAFRLFNGFLEGNPDLVIDLYGRTAVVHDYAKAVGGADVLSAQRWLVEQFDWLEAILHKRRFASAENERNGVMIHGAKLTRKVREHDVWYAVDLAMNRDASFYLDTRKLRRWLIDEMAGKRVLNTFAYTGSLGVAAVAGGAKRVVQTDLNKRFLNIAKTSHTLNGFPIDKRDFVTGDFWSIVKRFKRANLQFDCVILDPPFFAETAQGRFDLERDVVRLVNKIRPIVAHNGQIVFVNNALFLSGADYLAALQSLTADGYVEIEGRIDVDADFATGASDFVTDPTPFNHTTKIAILRVKHRT